MFECVVWVFIVLLLEYVISSFNFLRGCWFCYSCCWSVSRRNLGIVLLCVCVWCGFDCYCLEYVIVNLYWNVYFVTAIAGWVRLCSYCIGSIDGEMCVHLCSVSGLSYCVVF